MRGGGHSDYAWRRLVRGFIRPLEAPLYPAHGVRGAFGRAACDDRAPGDVLRTRRVAILRSVSVVARDRGAPFRAQDRCLGHLAWLGVPRRIVLFVAPDRRARR